MNTGHELRIAAGVSFDWKSLPPMVDALDGVPRDAEQLTFRRQGKSHGGIAELQNVRRLWAYQVNQGMIEEISQLANLEVLYVNEMSASALGCLGRLGKLRRLILHGGTKVEDLDWVAQLPATLDVLYLERFARVTDISPIGKLTRLTALGIEGGMDKQVRIETLEPLAALSNLRYLFLASADVLTKSLAPLRQLHSLERLECTIRFPEHEFIELKRSLPKLNCDWIGVIDEHGSLRAANAAILARIRRS